MPEQHQRCIESWNMHLSDYRIVRWDEKNTPIDTPFLRHCHRNKQWAFMSDYVRMRVIHEYGGIYLDTDVEVIKCFDPLLSNTCFMGYESKDRVNTAILGAAAGHEFMRKCMKIIDERHEKNLPYLIAPRVAKMALESMENKDLEIYPEIFFYPYNPYDPQRRSTGLMFSDIKPETFAIHHWGKSWKNPDGSTTRKLIRKINALLEEFRHKGPTLP